MVKLIKPLQELIDGSWRKNQETRKVSTIPTIPGELYYYYSPYCKHERCSYDIMNCDACVAHSKKLQQLRIDKKGAEDAAINR